MIEFSSIESGRDDLQNNGVCIYRYMTNVWNKSRIPNQRKHLIWCPRKSFVDEMNRISYESAENQNNQGFRKHSTKTHRNIDEWNKIFPNYRFYARQYNRWQNRSIPLNRVYCKRKKKWISFPFNTHNLHSYKLRKFWFARIVEDDEAKHFLMLW